MSVPAVYTWVDGTVVDADTFNTYVRDPQLWLLGVPMFSGWNTSPITVPSNAYTPVTLEIVDVNVNMAHNAGDSKVYANVPGWYRYIACAGLAATAYGNTDNRGVFPMKNGVTIQGGAYCSHAADSATGETILGCRSGFVWLDGVSDYVEVAAYQSTPSNTAITTFTTLDYCRSGLQLFWQGRDQ